MENVGVSAQEQLTHNEKQHHSDSIAASYICKHISSVKLQSKVKKEKLKTKIGKSDIKKELYIIPQSFTYYFAK